MAEIIEQDIIDSSVEVGSGCEWRGRGTEPNGTILNQRKLTTILLVITAPNLNPMNLWEDRQAPTRIKDSG